MVASSILRSTSNSCGYFVLWNALVVSVRDSDILESQTCRRMGQEVLMGHVPLLDFLRREVLSLFHLVSRFARRFYQQRESLWTSVRAELETFIGVMNSCQAFSSTMSLSLSGFGVAQFFGSISVVTAVGRMPAGGQYLSKHFRALGFRVGSCSGDVLRDYFGDPISLDLELTEIIAFERWESDSHFSESPSRDPDQSSQSRSSQSVSTRLQDTAPQ